MNKSRGVSEVFAACLAKPSNDARAYYWLEKYCNNNLQKKCPTTVAMLARRKAAVYAK